MKWYNPFTVKIKRIGGYKMAIRRVYRARNPPFRGGEYFEVKNISAAEKKVKQLNKKSKIKDWSWA